MLTDRDDEVQERDEIRQERQRDRQRNRNLARAAPDKRSAPCLGHANSNSFIPSFHFVHIDGHSFIHSKQLRNNVLQCFCCADYLTFAGLYVCKQQELVPNDHRLCDLLQIVLSDYKSGPRIPKQS